MAICKAAVLYPTRLISIVSKPIKTVVVVVVVVFVLNIGCNIGFIIGFNVRFNIGFNIWLNIGLHIGLNGQMSDGQMLSRVASQLKINLCFQINSW